MIPRSRTRVANRQQHGGGRRAAAGSGIDPSADLLYVVHGKNTVGLICGPTIEQSLRLCAQTTSS